MQTGNILKKIDKLIPKGFYEKRYVHKHKCGTKVSIKLYNIVGLNFHIDDCESILIGAFKKRNR